MMFWMNFSKPQQYVGLAEYVKSSADFSMRFVHEQENKPETGSFIHLAKNFQKQVQMMATTQENKNKTNTAPMIAKKRKTTKINISRYTLTNGRMINKRTGRLKKELNRTGINNEGSLEWLRGQINWDRE